MQEPHQVWSHFFPNPVGVPCYTRDTTSTAPQPTRQRKVQTVMQKPPSLNQLLTAQTKRDNPKPRIPSYLKQYTCPETTRHRNSAITYPDPTGEEAVNNLEEKHK